ncbi:unnamed protein product [Schistosoma margrebowiei]|uniref:Uncharacterized protein n=1 Tax=Schistosoma margrebowiei TaxID=48269 RepID=A0A183MAY6_9TREM|nr:unnamed protein product [Schistosoma margrebowiei]
MEITFLSTEFSGIDLPGGPHIDLEYTDDIVLFVEDADKMQSLLVALSSNVSMFGMHLSTSKSKLLLQDWSSSTPQLRIGSEVVERVDNFTYLGSLISCNELVSDEISARIQKARLAFAAYGEESVTKEEPKQSNTTDLPSNDDKKVSGCPSSVTNLTSKSEEYVFIPENVDARNISVNIERKHIRVSIKKDKKEIFCFDGDLCWEIHKNDAIWTFHSKENQVSHQSIAYTSYFYVRGTSVIAKMNL